MFFLISFNFSVLIEVLMAVQEAPVFIQLESEAEKDNKQSIKSY